MKIGAFITVRLGSTRLHNKALLKIKGRPTIMHLIERIKQAKNIDEIVLCTTTNSEDKKLIAIAKKLNIAYFTGDDKDIIKRHYDAANYHGVDFVINIDGDDLFCDPEYIDDIAKEAKKNYGIYDVIETKGLPFGVNSFGYKVDCLRNVFENKSQNNTDTGWGEFFRENKNLKKKVIQAKEKHIFKDKKLEPRMSLDYQEDLDFFIKVFEALYKEGRYFSYDAIIEFLKKNPNVIDINKQVEEIYWENYDKKKVIKDKVKKEK
ncbi:MAG: cytidylyltransferase domain-containing protein [Candidatus Heimdallarchaeota archaeon]